MPLTREDVERRFVELLEDNFGGAGSNDLMSNFMSWVFLMPYRDTPVEGSTDVVARYDLDSLDCVELVILAEREFEIDIEDGEYELCRTLDHCVDLVMGKLQQISPETRLLRRRVA